MIQIDNEDNIKRISGDFTELAMGESDFGTGGILDGCVCLVTSAAASQRGAVRLTAGSRKEDSGRQYQQSSPSFIGRKGMLRAEGVPQLGTGRGLLGENLGGLLVVVKQQVGGGAVSELHNYFKSRKELSLTRWI